MGFCCFIGLQLLNICALTSIWVMVAFLVQNSTVAVVANALLILMGKIPFWIVNAILGKDVHNNECYWVVSNIIYFRTLTPDPTIISNMIFVSLVYVVLFTSLGLLVFKKSSIK